MCISMVNRRENSLTSGKNLRRILVASLNTVAGIADAACFSRQLSYLLT